MTVSKLAKLTERMLETTARAYHDVLVQMRTLALDSGLPDPNDECGLYGVALGILKRIVAGDVSVADTSFEEDLVWMMTIDHLRKDHEEYENLFEVLLAQPGVSATHDQLHAAIRELMVAAENV